MTKFNKSTNKNTYRKNNHLNKKNNQSEISDIVASDVDSSEFSSSTSYNSSSTNSSMCKFKSDDSSSSSSNSSTSDSSSSSSSSDSSNSSSSDSSSSTSDYICISDTSKTKEYNLKTKAHKKKSKNIDFSSEQISSTSLKEKKNYDYVFLLKNLKSIWGGLCLIFKWIFMFAINMFGNLITLISSFLSKTIGKNTNIYDLKISKKGKNKNSNSKTFSLNKTSSVFNNKCSINSSSLNTELNLITSSLYGNKSSKPICKKSCNISSSSSDTSSCSSSPSSSLSKCKSKSKPKCYSKCKNNNIYPTNNTFTFSTLKNKISEKLNSFAKCEKKIPMIKNNFENTDLVSSSSVEKNKKHNQKKKIIKIPKKNKNIFIKKSKHETNNNKHINNTIAKNNNVVTKNNNMVTKNSGETVADTDMMNEIYNMLNM